MFDIFSFGHFGVNFQTIVQSENTAQSTRNFVTKGLSLTKAIG
jgi:hypothetical protein